MYDVGTCSVVFAVSTCSVVVAVSTCSVVFAVSTCSVVFAVSTCSVLCVLFSLFSCCVSNSACSFSVFGVFAVVFYWFPLSSCVMFPLVWLRDISTCSVVCSVIHPLVKLFCMVFPFVRLCFSFHLFSYNSG